MQLTTKIHSSGLRSLSVLSPDSGSVTIMIMVAVGSRHEQPNEYGLAHFVEHTIFKGTPTRPSSKQVGMEIESFGGSSNAFTSYDYTGYYIKVPKESFKEAFNVLADIFLNPLFPAADIEIERGVIIEEIKMYEDRPTSRVSDAWSQNFFGTDSSLGREISGDIDSVSNLKPEQFKEFIAKHYYAENCMVVVSGNVTQDEIDAAVEKNLSAIPAKGDKLDSGYPEFTFVESELRKKDIRIQKDLQQAHIIMGGLGIKRNDPERFALQVGNAILGSGFGSRLFQVIREEKGLAYYVYSRISSFKDTGVYQIGMGVDKNRIEESILAVKDQIAEIAAGKYTQQEFDRAKNYLVGGIVTDMETSEDLASYYGMLELLGQEKLTLEQLKDKIKAVTIADVQAVWQKVFTVENLYTTVLSS